MSKFKDRVIEITRLVPKGKVVSYGQVATMTGSPRAAIQVGWVLHLAGDDGVTPWWRVVNKEGYISTKCLEHSKNFQKELLERDGVKVNKDLKIDIKKYRWLPGQSLLEKLKLDEKYIYLLSERYRV
jgi:methylated-DNA-protein-cysteine methyltransferase-like protein